MIDIFSKWHIPLIVCFRSEQAKLNSAKTSLGDTLELNDVID